MGRQYDRKHRIWSIAVVRRDKVCVVCGSNQSRQAHHLDSYSYHPEKRYEVTNGVCLCRKCHTVYHCDYNKSFRVKTTRANFEEFLKVAKFYMSIGNMHLSNSLSNSASMYLTKYKDIELPNEKR